MKSSFWQRHPKISDSLSIIVFIAAVLVGNFLINSFVFQTFTVSGSSMENTFHNGDKVIVNRLPISWANLMNKKFIPNRGEIIVFQNSNSGNGTGNKSIIKRVIGLPGEKIVVKNGKITVFNHKNPGGFNPDDNFNNEPKSYTSNDGEWIVPEDELFVAGDNREGSNSYDSRSGLGTVPLYSITGPVSFRIFPFDKIRNFEYPQQK